MSKPFEVHTAPGAGASVRGTRIRWRGGGRHWSSRVKGSVSNKNPGVSTGGPAVDEFTTICVYE